MSIGLNGKAKPKEESNDTKMPNRFTNDGFAQSLEDDLEDDDPNDSPENIKKIAIVAAVVVFVIIIMFLFIPKLFNSSRESSKEELSQDMEEQYNDENNYSANEPDTSTAYDVTTDEEPAEGFVEEEPDYANSDKKQAVGEVESGDGFVVSLDGQQIPADYVAKNISYVKAYVNYELHRGTVDDGMEVYWIDILYKKKKYRAQIPFYYAKDLSSEGICRVEMELIDLESGGQVITYMQVTSSDDGTE